MLVFGGVSERCFGTRQGRHDKRKQSGGGGERLTYDATLIPSEWALPDEVPAELRVGTGGGAEAGGRMAFSSKNRLRAACRDETSGVY